ncbi:hypothetical protein NZK35_00875 [Stieleria sp. ICT_E10.1]|uniref:hypothetical protein n=1 Tax=Stieleria sedimenti TaxID=2976331 RepID=UPI00217FDA62|nr:hypothetical protein [Stieleria sedimenti]MCS7465221.1 hypothetical protein [Stieleria sedimenti]
MTDPEDDIDPREDARQTRTRLTDGDSGFSRRSGGDPIGETIDSASVTNLSNRPEEDDDELRRHVTIKVPHTHRIKTSKDVSAFLSEAQTLGKLEH